MSSQSIIIYERLNYWSRQLRPRFQGHPIRWTEARSSTDLARSASGFNFPIFVIELADDPIRGLQALDAGLMAAPSALSLVIDPLIHDGLPMTARELGATVVLSGMIVPPEVVALLHRWIPMATSRAEAEGWSVTFGLESEP